MNRFMKYAAAALAAATAVSTLGGCEQLEQKTPEDTVAVTFGDTNIMLDEVTYMIRSMEYTYESYFGSNICSNDMGDGSGMTVGDYIKQMSLSQLRQTLVLNEYAEQNGIELSDAQKAKVDDAIEKLKEEGEDYLNAVGATDELIEKTYTENAIANLVYMDLVADVDTTVGDDEFLRKKIAYVKLTPSELTETTAAEEGTTVTETESGSEEEASSEAGSSEETSEAGSEEASSENASDEAASSEVASDEADSTEEASTEKETETSTEVATETETETESASDTEVVTEVATEAESESESNTESDTESDTEVSNGSEESTEAETLSEEEQERQDAMNDAADKILKEFEDGSDAADFISDYQNDSHFTATNSEISISEEGTAVYNAAAWALSTDECTIYNSDDGSIYIIRCLDDNDEEARQSAIDSEIESRKTALFEEKYSEIQDASSKFKVDQDVIDTIRFTTPVYVAPTEEDTTEETTENASEEASSEDASSEEASSESESESSSEEVTEESAEKNTESESESEKESTSEAETK